MKFEIPSIENVYRGNFLKVWPFKTGHLEKKIIPVKKDWKAQILIIDSETNILNLLYAILSGSYKITLKASSMEALLWIEEGNTPSLIITEFNLPHFKGSAFINYLKASGFHNRIPVIILSDINIENEIKQSPLDVAAILKKPFDPVDLKKKIKTILYEYKLTLTEG